jgi:hypothetical protein
MSGKRAKPGRTLGLGPPEGQPWTWQTNAMLGSVTYRALGISAIRVMQFLMHEHAAHGGRENGNLAAPYRQLEAWGVTAADVRKGLAELYATGFLVQTRQGQRQAGGREPSRYALTWLPTHAGSPQEKAPSHAWTDALSLAIKQGVVDVQSAKAWLRAATAHYRRKAAPKKRKTTPHLQVVSPINCEATA